MDIQKILVCGGRDYSDRHKVYQALSLFKGLNKVKIIHGAAAGADSLAEEAAIFFGYEVESFPADWKRYGRAAGPVRNKVMLDQDPDLVVAFPGGPGTENMKMIARNAGVLVIEVN